MGRRASSKFHPVWIFLILGMGILLMVIGRFIVTEVNDPYRTLTPIEVATYLENSNSLRGNVYRMRGTIENSLAWSPATGRLFSMRIDGPDGVNILPVLVPPEFNHVNIQRGEQFTFRVEVGEKGMILARNLSKS